jgi:Flp pilus assembly protein TadB
VSSAVLLSIVFAAGVALCLLGFAPEYYRSPFRPLMRSDAGPLAGFKRRLTAAGMFDEAPTFIIVIALLGSAVLGLVFAIFLGNSISFILGPTLVGLVGYVYLNRRMKHLIHVTADALVPFIRRVEGSVRVGTPWPAAYREAVQEAPVALRRMLQESLADMATGMPPIEAIAKTEERIPLRTWEIFVRQLEIHDEAGGDLSKGLSATVRHIDTMASLQRQGRAHYSTFASQQKIAFVLGGLFIVFMATKMAPDLVHRALTSVVGWIFIIAGCVLVGAGIGLMRNTLNAIEKRINF